MIPAILIRLVGEKAAPYVFFGAIGVALLVALFALSRCGHDTTAQQQAGQTTRSGDAISNAASSAIETIGNRTATDATIDAVTINAQEEIANAQDAGAIRDAVVAGVCGSPSHRHDPACAVR
jgi:hypothetical protein